MQMTFRWFGSEKDTVTLEQIRQIPNVVGVVPALHNLPAGEAWELDDIMKMKYTDIKTVDKFRARVYDAVRKKRWCTA